MIISDDKAGIGIPNKTRSGPSGNFHNIAGKTLTPQLTRRHKYHSGTCLLKYLSGVSLVFRREAEVVDCIVRTRECWKHTDGGAKERRDEPWDGVH